MFDYLNLNSTNKWICALDGVLFKSILTGSLSLSGMLSMDILEPGRDSDSRSSFDLRNVS